MERTGTRPQGIPFDTMPSKLWDDVEKVSYLQRRVLVYSMAYYNQDTNIVSDMEYDGVSRQLAKMQANLSPKEFQRTRYGYAFEGFDGSTAFDIPSKLSVEDYEYLYRITMHTISMRQPEGKNKKRKGRK